MRIVFLAFFLGACAVAWRSADVFTFVPVSAGGFDIATYQKITDTHAPVHIYIEGDGHAFDAYGTPTDDPTPRGTMLRDLAMRDTAANVIYMARPCQFIMSGNCTKKYWTDGRFAPVVVDAMGAAVTQVADGRQIVLVGYSGGAMVSGLVIKRNPGLPVKKWITIAGVLNHAGWTEYFGDAPLRTSLDLRNLPNVHALHYVGADDEVVPNALSQKWIGDSGKIVVIPNAGHEGFKDLDIDFE
ncbi:MAG: hypothetical protein J6Y07_03415 [Alphaproteobacteria bacterium]|nr:hypothetical protein [Alphaproteobacteria bacterium]